MGRKTKIDWCDSTWNPVTGCLHGCEYCYAKRIARRFGWTNEYQYLGADRAIHELKEPVYDFGKERNVPYPFAFEPTFHRYRLGEPVRWTRPRTIFVCSMADLFGDWVPDEWIQEVFKACDAAPWHRYLFLTKNHGRYMELYEKGIMPVGIKAFNKWFGCTITKPTDQYFFNNLYGNGTDHNGFLSIEPISADFDAGQLDKDETGVKWVIIGAETGNRKAKIIPKREWVEHVVQTCDASGIPVFMKESLRGLMVDDFRQEFPWEARA